MNFSFPLPPPSLQLEGSALPTTPFLFPFLIFFLFFFLCIAFDSYIYYFLSHPVGVSLEKIEIDPVLQPKSAKKFWGKQKFVSIMITVHVVNTPANFKMVTRTIQFIHNQWYLKHDWIKLHYSQLWTTIITITKQNMKWQKTMQNIPDSLDRRSTWDAAKKQS